jgi:hypothetical protein
MEPNLNHPMRWLLRNPAELALNYRFEGPSIRSQDAYSSRSEPEDWFARQRHSLELLCFDAR